jgi:protein arginine N-methyltransferase 5
MFNAVNILSGNGTGSEHCGPQIQECWEFEHPRKDPVVDASGVFYLFVIDNSEDVCQGLSFTNSHNSRSAKLRYHIPHTGILHGLAGYFEAVLYSNIGLSIHPRRKDKISKDMLSWFPLFFPFKVIFQFQQFGKVVADLLGQEPLYLPGNSELHVSIWRRTGQRRVWYEWYAESFLSVRSDHPSSEGGERGIGDSTFTKSLPPFGGGSSPSDTVGVPPSPLVDAIDSPSAGGRPRAEAGKFLDRSTPGHGLVKIGQTALHNPGGRSSRIRL